MDSTIRKYQSQLRTSGLAIIIFGFWTIIELIIISFISNISVYEYFTQYMDTSQVATDEQKTFITWLAIIVAIVFFLISMLVRFFIGIQSIRQSKGKKVNGFYLGVVVFDLCIIAIGVGFSIGQMFTPFATIDTIPIMIGSSLVDLTSCFALLIILTRAIKLRKHLKQAKLAGEVA